MLPPSLPRLMRFVPHHILQITAFLKFEANLKQLVERASSDGELSRIVDVVSDANRIKAATVAAKLDTTDAVRTSPHPTNYGFFQIRNQPQAISRAGILRR